MPERHLGLIETRGAISLARGFSPVIEIRRDDPRTVSNSLPAKATVLIRLANGAKTNFPLSIELILLRRATPAVMP